MSLDGAGMKEERRATCNSALIWHGVVVNVKALLFCSGAHFGSLLVSSPNCGCWVELDPLLSYYL